MQVYASGGDGQEIPYWFVGYLPSMRSAVVAHQGTNFDNLQSVLTDFRFWPTTLDPTLFPGLPNGISVHSGFKDMHTSSASEILETVTKIIQQEKTTQVVMIGHSLGGALAQLDAALLRLHLPKDISLKVVTYEQPRVGNGQWANWYDNNIPDTHRITNKHDPVPTLPWKFLLYTHTQGEKHIVDDQKGVWYDCAGQDNPSSLYCSTGVVSNILKGNTSDHAGPYNGLYSPPPSPFMDLTMKTNTSAPSSVKLCCFLEGTNTVFSVKADNMNDVDDLKELIKSKWSNRLKMVASPSLDLWRISKSQEEALKLTAADFEGQEPLSPKRTVGECWTDLTAQVHVFVADPLRVQPAQKDNCRGTKRGLDEDPVEANKRIKSRFAATDIPAPTTMWNLDDFNDYGKKGVEPRIRCGRPAGDHSTIPIILAHRVFADFVQSCKTYNPTTEDMVFVLRLAEAMCGFYCTEEARASSFRTILKDYGIPLTSTLVEQTSFTRINGAHLGQCFYAIISVAESFGTTEKDPYIQGGLSHTAALRKVCDTTTRPLPCMHIFFSGSIVGFAGSILTEALDMNVLGPMIPLFWHSTDTELRTLAAQMFGAFKQAVATLKAYYEAPDPIPFQDPRFPWVVEYHPLDRPADTRKFRYIRRMAGDQLVYKCQDCDSGERIVVKFVQTYSKEVHLECVALGCAPKLYGFDAIACGWFIVVMELLDLDDNWFLGVAFQGDEVRPIYEEVKKYVSALQARGYVHGDIRRSNVLVKSSKEQRVSVRLIDFDWAGKVGEAKYPLLVNPDLGGIRKPTGVKGGGCITMEHDLAMVELLLCDLD
ncbi:hypothetical protein FRB99_006916 [Tulasnella sp. 403]|nr:hypothetical protein FRB99_006916 [Tulasnella sp. 403]